MGPARTLAQLSRSAFHTCCPVVVYTPGCSPFGNFGHARSFVAVGAPSDVSNSAKKTGTRLFSLTRLTPTKFLE